MNITGTTKLLGIIGDPIEHTISPAMQNAAIKANLLNWAYVPFHVKPQDLKTAVNVIKAFDMIGVNVTIPHKEKVIKLLDEVEDTARLIGAVNTVLNVDGRLIGYNTDGFGYIDSLKEETDFDSRGKNIVLLGAGGAARSILFSFLFKSSRGMPASIVIANRTVERAKKLVSEFKKKLKNLPPIKAVGMDAAAAHLENADILINTTSLGLMGKGQISLPLKKLPEYAIVSDIVYRPLETKFLKSAKALGLKTHGGLGMLAHQGALSFEIWTLSMFPRPPVPLDIMKNAALLAMGSVGPSEAVEE